MAELEKILDLVAGYVWGAPLLILLFGTHLFLTFRLRFIQRYTGKKFYKVKTRYEAPEYLSYESVTLQGQNGTKITVDTIYPQKQSSVDSDGINEWSDNEIAEDDKIIRLAKSNSITVTFKGGNRYTF